MDGGGVKVLIEHFFKSLEHPASELNEAHSLSTCPEYIAGGGGVAVIHNKFIKI